jgi:hypothetical protein
MRKWLSFVVLFLCLFFAAPGYSETYCIRNDGSAGSKTAATDCLTVGNCINETVHNGETFAANDVILVCPHGGAFNLAVTTPSSGTSGNEITYGAVYDTQYGWPVFDEGFTIATDYIIAYGFEARPGIAEAGTKTFEGGRFANETRTWQAGEETGVESWDKDDLGIFAVGLGVTGGALANLTPQLYWRDKTDAGSFAAVGAAGEVKYAAVSGLTDNDNVTSGEAGISSGKAYETCLQCEQEDSHQASTTTSFDAEEWAELQIGVSLADSDPDHKYEFALYESAAQVGPASVATVSTEYCEDAGGTDPTDEICEDAAGTNVIETGTDDFDTARHAWDSATMDGNNTLYEAAHSGTLSCKGKGDYAIQVFVDNDTGSDYTAAIKESITATSSLYANFYINIISADWEHSEDLALFSFVNAAGGAWHTVLYLKRSGSNLYFLLGYTDDGWTHQQEIGTTVISMGTWYRIGLEWNQNTANGAKLYLNGSIEVTGSGTTVDQAVGQVWPGAVDGVSSMEQDADAVTYQLSNIGIDNDTMPGACN